MKRTLLAFTIFLFAICSAYAQMALTGKVYELNTTNVLPSVKVQNTRTKDNTLTNAAGIFTIKAKAGDVLTLEGYFYKTDTILVTNARYLEIYLTLKTDTLKEVKILNTTTRLGHLRDTTLHNQTVTNQTDAFGNPIGGISFNFGYGKSSKEKKDEQRAYNEHATEEIDNAFSPANISKYVPLKGVELKQFIALYRPTIKQYKALGFHLPFYLDDCYKKFVVLTPDQRKLPALVVDSVKSSSVVKP